MPANAIPTWMQGLQITDKNLANELATAAMVDGAEASAGELGTAPRPKSAGRSGGSARGSTPRPSSSRGASPKTIVPSRASTPRTIVPSRSSTPRSIAPSTQTVPGKARPQTPRGHADRTGAAHLPAEARPGSRGRTEAEEPVARLTPRRDIAPAFGTGDLRPPSPPWEHWDVARPRRNRPPQTAKGGGKGDGQGPVKGAKGGKRHESPKGKGKDNRRDRSTSKGRGRGQGRYTLGLHGPALGKDQGEYPGGGGKR